MPLSWNEIRRRAMALGAKEYLVKAQFSWDSVAERVRQYARAG